MNKKQVIRLNENQLNSLVKKIVNESVKKVLKERINEAYPTMNYKDTERIDSTETGLNMGGISNENFHDNLPFGRVANKIEAAYWELEEYIDSIDNEYPNGYPNSHELYLEKICKYIELCKKLSKKLVNLEIMDLGQQPDAAYDLRHAPAEEDREEGKNSHFNSLFGDRYRQNLNPNYEPPYRD